MPTKKSRKRKEPLTEEQKAKLAEQKALAEKEKLIRRKRLTNAFLKLKKDKEYELLKLNENKLLDLWRPRLRKLKNDELLEDFQAYHTAFERNLQKKDELIEALQDLLNQNDEEYDNAFDMHLHNIDNILEFYKKRLGQVRGMYSEARQKLVNVLNEEKYKMQNYQEKSLRYLQGVMTAVNMRYREMASDSKAELFVRQEEIRNKANEETHAAQVEAERRMADIWKKFAEWLVDYDQTALPLKTEYSEIKKKDDVVVATIESQLRKVHAFQRGFHNLTKQDKTFCLALQKYLDELNAKKNELKAAHRLQQRRFNEFKRMGLENIRTLALYTRHLIERLDEMVKKRETLLRCVERCRKNERLDEKVDPFMLRWKLEPLETLESLSDHNASTLYFPNELDIDGFAFRPSKIDHHLVCECDPCTCEVQAEEVDQTGLNAPISKFIREYSVMEKFWTRLNRVGLEKRVLLEKKKELGGDNMKLKLALRSYMGGMNPQNQDLYTFAGDLLVIPGSPIPYFPHLPKSPSIDSDIVSNASEGSSSIINGHGTISPENESMVLPTISMSSINLSTSSRGGIIKHSGKMGGYEVKVIEYGRIDSVRRHISRSAKSGKVQLSMGAGGIGSSYTKRAILAKDRMGKGQLGPTQQLTCTVVEGVTAIRNIQKTGYFYGNLRI